MDCPQCGKALEEGKTFCKYCGARVDSRPQEGEVPHTGEELVGRAIGKYLITDLVGRGGMATVYKAQHPGLGTSIAIKVLHPHLAGDPSFVGRFRREAQAISTLRHPNIVRVLDFDNQSDLYYMVLEYIDGPSLSSYLTELYAQDRRVTPEETVRLFTPLCSALDYAHGLGMIHRDIKPGNILLTSDHVPVITDYGIAKITGATSYTSPGLVVGSVHYMSPEQAQGLPADGRSDVYSLGVVLFEVVTGRVPFEGETPVSIIVQHLSSPIPAAHFLNPDLTPAMEDVLTKVLAKDPEQRYAQAGDLARALSAALGTAEIRTVRPPAVEPTRVDQPADLGATRFDAAATAAAAATGAGAAAGAGAASAAAKETGISDGAPSAPVAAQAYAPPPGWIPEVPPREKPQSKKGLVVALVALVLLLAGGGTAAALFVASGGDEDGTTTTGLGDGTTIVLPGTTLPETVTSIAAGTTITIPGYDSGGSTTDSSHTESTVDAARYVTALDDLETVLAHADERIPKLAEQINVTAPNVPESVDRELETLYDDIQRAREALGTAAAPAEYQRADELIFQATDAMQYRIDQTIQGCVAMRSTGDAQGGKANFNEGRKARDEYRAVFAEYQAARP